jgi:hypothetical protein
LKRRKLRKALSDFKYSEDLNTTNAELRRNSDVSSLPVDGDDTCISDPALNAQSTAHSASSSDKHEETKPVLDIPSSSSLVDVDADFESMVVKLSLFTLNLVQSLLIFFVF